MGYVSYTTANTSGAQAFSDAISEVNAFNADLVHDMAVIADNNASVADKYNAYKLISDFQSGGGPYANLAGTKIEALKASLLKDVDRQLNNQLISMPIDNSGDTAAVMVNGHQATALDIVKNWNSPSVVFSFSWQNTDGTKGNLDDHDTNVPWCNQPLNDLTGTDGNWKNGWKYTTTDHEGQGNASTYVDANGKTQTIPGGGINVDMTHVMSHCENHYDITASGSAQAIAGFTHTTFVSDPGFNFKDSYNQDLADAGLSTVA